LRDRLAALFGLIALGAVCLGGEAGAHGTWQTPGAIQQPTGPWQTPGQIQKPGAIQTVQHGCERRLVVAGDALFDFNKSTLTAQAAQSLAALGPKIVQAARPPEVVEGHTDSIGGVAYNLTLSEARARAVRDWLAVHGFIAAGAPIKGYGASRPVAPNTLENGADNPAGRALNRRVEVVIRTCS